MFTKNYYKAIATTVTTKQLHFKNINGAESNLITASSAIIIFGMKYNGNQSYPSMYYICTDYSPPGGVIFGTGSTPPTIDDYCLSGELVTGFSYISNVSYTEIETGASVKAVYTITNNNSEPITISEVALMSRLKSGYSGAAVCGLLERTVLDTPVTIPAGGVGQVEYTITFNLPTAT